MLYGHQLNLIGLTLKRPADKINKKFVISSQFMEGNY